MKKAILSLVILSLIPLQTLAVGGLAGWYAGEFGGVGGSSNITPSSLSPVVVDVYNTYPTYTPTSPSNNFIGGYSGFIESQTLSTYNRDGTGGLTEYYAQNQLVTGPEGGTGGLSEHYETTPPEMTPSEPQQNGFSEYWTENRNNGNFDFVCRPEPRPTSATCQGGSFVPLRNNYGCTIDWRCEGGQYCPIARRPAPSSCRGTLEPQYNRITGCLTHYFCDRTPDVIPDPTPECLGSIYECRADYRNPWLRAWGQ